MNLSEFEEFGDFLRKQSQNMQKRQEDFLPIAHDNTFLSQNLSKGICFL